MTPDQLTAVVAAVATVLGAFGTFAIAAGTYLKARAEAREKEKNLELSKREREIDDTERAKKMFEEFSTSLQKRIGELEVKLKDKTEEYDTLFEDFYACRQLNIRLQSLLMKIISAYENVLTTKLDKTPGEELVLNIIKDVKSDLVEIEGKLSKEA